MPSKTPSIFTVYLFIAGIISVNSAIAAAPKTYSECQAAYFQAVSVPEANRTSTAVINTMKAWCTSQCVNEKISAYATQQGQTVTADLTTQLTPAYQPACTAQFGSTTASTVATVPATGSGTTSGSGLPECAWQSQPSVTPTGDQQYQCQIAIQRKQVADQQKAAAAAEQLRLQQQQQAQESAQRRGQNTMLGAAALPLVGQLASGLSNGMSGSSGSNSAGSGSGSSGNTGSYALTPFGSGPANVGAAPPPPAPIPTPAEIPATVANNTQQMDSMASRLPEQLQTRGQEASQNINGDANGTNPTPPTRITQAANQGSNTLNGHANSVMTTLRTLLCKDVSTGNPGVKFAKTLGAFEKFMGNGSAVGCGGSGAAGGAAPGAAAGAATAAPGQTPPAQASGGGNGGRPACAEPSDSKSAVQNLNDGRNCQCAQAAESAERLCVESEGMKGMRTVMDMAGPLLLGMNAAAKTCGGMADVSKFVGAGLTVANALCIREKMKCESTCNQVLTKFTTDYTKFQTDVQREYNTERQAAITACQQWENNTTDPNAQTYLRECRTNLSAVGSQLPQGTQMAGQINTGERNPSNFGTVPSLDALCKAKQRNIVGLATNIGAIALAAMNAKKCEKELAAKGAGDETGVANVAGAEYCSADATKDTQFCKCQSSPSTQGCAAVLAAGPPTENTPNDQRGVNLQGNGGPSAFAGAGGGGGSGAAGGYRGYNAGADGSSTTPSNLGSITSTMGNGGGGTVGGLAGAGGGAAGSGSADAKAVKKEEDKGKWSFGSFASSIGSSLGFGGGGGYRGNDTNTPPAGDQAAMIERKLASDRYSAEVSPSTGADNFSKIKRSYVQKADTFMGP